MLPACVRTDETDRDPARSLPAKGGRARRPLRQGRPPALLGQPLGVRVRRRQQCHPTSERSETRADPDAVLPRRAEIEALLAAGTSVVCDRYAFSGLAFSMAKVHAVPATIELFQSLMRPPLQGLDQRFLQTPDTGLPLPDLTLFLTLSAQEAARRGGYGEERSVLAQLQPLIASRLLRDWALTSVPFQRPADTSSKRFRRSSAPSSTSSAPHSTRHTVQPAGSRSTLAAQSTTSRLGSGSLSRFGSGRAGGGVCGSRRSRGEGRMSALDDCFAHWASRCAPSSSPLPL